MREKWDELTADERQMLEEWRQEEESHEQLYRRLAEPGALRRHFDELAAVDTERALAYNRKLLQRYALRRVVRWSLPYAAVVAIVSVASLLKASQVLSTCVPSAYVLRVSSPVASS